MIKRLNGVIIGLIVIRLIAVGFILYGLQPVYLKQGENYLLFSRSEFYITFHYSFILNV